LEHINYAKSIPVRYEADIAVIGGGIAGVYTDKFPRGCLDTTPTSE
jgi:hypothetical protein